MSTGFDIKRDGDGRAFPAAAPTLTITVTDLATFSVKIDGTVPSLDYALNMLAQATREYESQWRLARAAQHQQQMRQAAQDEQIRRELQRRN